MNTRSLCALRVLIVDDNPLDRADAKAALVNGSLRAFQFSEASSAREALLVCMQSPLPDCIVLDLGLPDADEFDVLNSLPRDEDNLLRVPVVVLTASAQLGQGPAALRAGAQDYVGKSWLLPETLTQAVENAIERLRIARELEAQRRMAEAAKREAIEFRAESRQMQEANRLKSQFLANMSHELRTPLAAVIGFADLLLNGQVSPDSAKHRVFLGHIASSGRHLLSLINDVLDLSKVEAGRLEFFPESFDLAVLVHGINAVLVTEFQRKRLGVSTDIEPGLGDLVLDPSRLKQVLYNYLSNAVKFTSEGGRITVRVRSAGARHFRLEVEDTGVGIAAQDIARLFTAYQQLDAGPTKRYQGSGLGLALTRRLITAQGGSVGVRSTPGAGSVFHVVLNRIHGTDTVRDVQEQEHPPTRSAGRLLIVDDGGDGLLELLTGLAADGYDVDRAATVEQAAQRASVTTYDAIALGPMRPDRHGLGVLQRIRHAGPSRASPVVGMRIRGSTGAAVTFAIADVLCKPIRAHEIASAMARLRPPGTRPISVLVVDDDAVALELMRLALRAIGIDATCLPGGRQALQELDRHRPDAIVLDLVMPEFDGFAMLDRLQQLPAWRHTPVFIWTSLELSDADCTSLGQSAAVILGSQGGSTSAALESWRSRQTVAVGPPTGVAS